MDLLENLFKTVSVLRINHFKEAFYNYFGKLQTSKHFQKLLEELYYRKHIEV